MNYWLAAYRSRTIKSLAKPQQYIYDQLTITSGRERSRLYDRPSNRPARGTVLHPSDTRQEDSSAENS